MQVGVVKDVVGGGKVAVVLWREHLVHVINQCQSPATDCKNSALREAPVALQGLRGTPQTGPDICQKRIEADSAAIEAQGACHSVHCTSVTTYSRTVIKSMCVRRGLRTMPTLSPASNIGVIFRKKSGLATCSNNAAIRMSARIAITTQCVSQQVAIRAWGFKGETSRR